MNLEQLLRHDGETRHERICISARALDQKNQDVQGDNGLRIGSECVSVGCRRRWVQTRMKRLSREFNAGRYISGFCPAPKAHRLCRGD